MCLIIQQEPIGFVMIGVFQMPRSGDRMPSDENEIARFAGDALVVLKNHNDDGTKRRNKIKKQKNE